MFSHLFISDLNLVHLVPGYIQIKTQLKQYRLQIALTLKAEKSQWDCLYFSISVQNQKIPQQRSNRNRRSCIRHLKDRPL